MMDFCEDRHKRIQIKHLNCIASCVPLDFLSGLCNEESNRIWGHLATSWVDWNFGVTALIRLHFYRQQQQLQLYKTEPAKVLKITLISSIFNSPGVARAVLQTIINLLFNDTISLFLPISKTSSHPNQNWNVDWMFNHLSRVTCHVSGVMCHL